MQEFIEMRKRLGEKVRALREKRGWSQETLAHETGFGRSFMSAIERGKKDIRLSTLYKLSALFETTPSQLLKDTTKMLVVSKKKTPTLPKESRG
jgi:transcriptional regulator with XRE-family HTH domain